MKICNRPRASSSVTREIDSKPINNYGNKSIKYNNNENQNNNSNKLKYEVEKKNNRINTQRRKLQPPNFQISCNVASITTNYYNRQSSNQSKENDLDSFLSVKKATNLSVTRRSQSEARHKKNNDSYQDYKNNLKSKNKKEENVSLLYSLKKSQDEISKIETQKISSRQNEFKNSDGTIKKISEKFHGLSKNQSNNSLNEVDYSSQSSIFSNESHQYLSAPNNLRSINLNIELPTTQNMNDSNDCFYSSIKTVKHSISNNKHTQKSSKTEELNENRNQANEKLYDSINLAMNRIKKEINEKEYSSKGVKPMISKKKRSILNEKNQTSKSIDFEFLNDEPILMEQNNKSNNEKPHVSFMNSFQPPKKKNNDNLTAYDDNEILSVNEIINPEKQELNLNSTFKSTCKSRKASQEPNQNQEIDEFIQMEIKIKDEVEDDKGDVIPNFLKIIKILRDQLDKSQYQEVIRIMNKNKSKHFLLLLAQPLMNIDAVYVMRGDLKFAYLLWGYGPEKVTKNKIDQYWKYNVTNKLFDDQQLSNFEPNLDAITIIKK